MDVHMFKKYESLYVKHYTKESDTLVCVNAQLNVWVGFGAWVVPPQTDTSSWYMYMECNAVSLSLSLSLYVAQR